MGQDYVLSFTLVPLIPIQETEAWMLADTVLLKEQIGTKEEDTTLGIHRQPESVANPKEVIENAIRLAHQSTTKRRRCNLVIGDLYGIMGVSIDLEKLEKLSAYQDFKNNIRQVFRQRNILSI